MTEEQHARRKAAREYIHVRADRAHYQGMSALTFEGKMMQDEALLEDYDGNRMELEREVDAMTRVVWKI